MTPKEARELWAQALESGQYKQGYGRLAPDDQRHCCLGVACELAVQAKVIPDYDPWDGDLAAYEPVREWLGLATDEGAYEGGNLVKDNDTARTFTEIAATIRAEPEGLVTT
jgi:hypothetical protein